ncbi:MAG: hypothetical protein KJ804_11185 [Proteobacteria bacterium]|nr:hypothetical protein [Pseudomonadota bacterium]MBU1058869.1 hypothetical protein [Pseudomonadota bacterium]
MAKKALDELLLNLDDAHLEEVEVLTNPLRTLRDGVKFIPTLKYGDEQLSGILLNRAQIEAFLQRVHHS